MEELLTTKLFIPPTRTEIVSRPRLIARLDEGLHQKLTLISAPAGFGKTTLVIEWLDGLRKGANQRSNVAERIGWLSLDEADNDPTRFLTYFIAALNQIEAIDAPLGQGALNMLQSPHPPPTETTVTSLINEMAAIPGRLVLILDDYHLIEAPAVHSGLNFLLDNMPPQMHLVIATREDPPLHLARLRARDQLTELRAMDLRFTSSEAAEFLNQVMRLNLATEDIVALDERTEGWIAGLQLAAISMQGHEDTRGLIKSFTGSHRFVLDYLIEEVLEQQPAPIQNFLLQTAILSRLTGALCNAVTEQEGSQAILEMLDHDNLFIVPLDEERLWYRYHHLFAGLLKQRLQQSHHPTQVSTIHHRASLWYEENGFTEKSIEHALRGEDFERAAQLIEVVAESVWMRGVDTRLRHWLARLPDDLLLSQPRLCIFHAWYLLAGGNQVAADRVLTNVEVALERRQHTPLDGGSALHGRLATIQAFSAFYRGDVRAIIRSARTALEYLPEEALSWRSTATHLLGDAYDFNGEFREGYQFRLAAVQTSRASGNQVQIVIANLKLATNLRYQGRLQEAIEICQQQQMFANESGMAQTVVGGWLLAIWGEALAEINDLDEAIHKVRQGVEICERGGDLAMGGWSYLCLIRVLFSRGDLPGAGAIVHKLENLARESFVPPWIMNLNAAWQARLWLGQGKLDRVAQWAEERGLDVNSNPGYVHEMEYTMLARLLIANKKLDMATALLQRQLEAAEAGGRTSRVIEILILRAFVFHKEGDTARAMSALEEALTLAAPGGFIRIFVDEGAPMAQLLFRANDAGVMPVYVATLLSAIATRSEPPGDTLAPPHAPQPSPLIEPLSDRELEVLQLVAQGLTNREIGERLYLALDTVKGHNRRIYGKLQVHRRIDAIARARDLGLL